VSLRSATFESSVPVSVKTRRFSTTKTDQLMPFSQISLVYCDNCVAQKVKEEEAFGAPVCCGDSPSPSAELF
jgi:hypothetical protein